MAKEIDKHEISRSEADRILQIEESHHIDLKAIEADPANLSEAVSAFSNTAGGERFVGIDEKIVVRKKVRTWRGFKDLEAANDRIATIERMSPLGNHYRAERGGGKKGSPTGGAGPHGRPFADFF